MCPVQTKINELNAKLGLERGQVGFYVLNRDAGLYDIRLTNKFGDSDGHITLGRSKAGQFALESDAVNFVNGLILTHE